MAKLKMKQLRTEVIKKINELMKGGDVMEFEMSFDRQEGMSFHGIVDSKESKYVSGKYFYDEKGEVVDESHDMVCESTDGFPKRLYDIYDSTKLTIGNQPNGVIEDEIIGDGEGDLET